MRSNIWKTATLDRKMKLNELLKGIFLPELPSAWRDVAIPDIVSDSRKVIPGSLFVALAGPVADGAQFIDQAREKGAVVIVRTGPEPGVQVEEKTLILTVSDTQAALQILLKNFYHDISRQIKIIGITGTNGKTTITYLLESIFQAAGKSCGVIGTVNVRYGGKIFPVKNTTPGLIDVHHLLEDMKEAKCPHCVMEVSSHALVQGRVGGLDFRAAVFTNLTSDHLDYHRTREEYFLAKARLFTGLSPQALALINGDDDFAQRLMSMSRGQVQTFGIKNPADFYAQGVQLHFSGTTFTLKTPEGQIQIQTPLIGNHNVSNILAAAGVAQAQGVSLAQIKKGIELLRNVPGRLERVEAGQKFPVLVDYAHTEDALKNVLGSLRQVSRGRILLVFGCGGDRDKTKRPLMGKIAGEMADFSIVTNDNPRSEDPQDITQQIIPGFRQANFKIVLDRRQAIKEVLGMAGEGDIVLIAGKGHEDYQIFKKKTIPFDERCVVRECVEELLKER